MMNTTELGKDAEEKVANELKSKGHKILFRNWRNRWCEIDIVSTKDKCVFFTEVKYRSSSKWGSGFEYVGHKKIQQMNFAAEFWIHDHKWKYEAQLQAAAVDSYGEIEIVKL